jgi:transcriptional regulatory protein LevR
MQVEPNTIEALVSIFYRAVLAVSTAGVTVEGSNHLSKLLHLLMAIILQQPDYCDAGLILQLVQHVCCMLERLLSQPNLRCASNVCAPIKNYWNIVSCTTRGIVSGTPT